MQFENSKVNFVDNYKNNLNNLPIESIEMYNGYSISNEQIANTPYPNYLDYNTYSQYQQHVVYNPQNYKLPSPNHTSIFVSNIIEFWAPITDIIIPNIVPGRYWVSSWGRTWNANVGRPFGLGVHNKGYYQISFSKTDGTRSTNKKLHRLIMLTFAYFNNCEQYEVNHKDSIRTDCRLCNLEWTLPKDNTIHGINFGFKKVFGNDYKVRLSDEQVKQIYLLHKNENLGPQEIMDRLNIRDITNRKTVVLIYLGYNRRSITKYLD